MDEESTGGEAFTAPPAKAPEATFEDLVKKPRRALTFPLTLIADDGEERVVKMRYRAIPSRAYDALVEAHPPTPAEKKKGAVYNVDTFAPALISAVSEVPRLSVEQAAELYTSDDWSGGEISTLFINALRVCNAGLDVSFSESD